MQSRQEAGHSLDYFPTPPFATRALMEVVLPEIGITHHQFRISSVYEPACGEGHMAEVLREYCAATVASDIEDYGYGLRRDFLTNNNYSFLVDWIITNPPYNGRELPFALKAIECATIGVAFFVRTLWLETIGRYERLFSVHPPAIIAQFAERVPICKGRWNPDGSTATAYLWIVWLKERRDRQTRFFWIPPGQRAALTRPDDVEWFTAHPVRRRMGAPIGPILSQSPAAPSLSPGCSSPGASVTPAVESQCETPADLSFPAE